ncbi:MAG TPA: D-alanyl-D-alanine carboxypeptidase, partial [Aliiroseovarius sp.]|nr:D-alanyl-D-alanine carboxypeptidase [Aliiroseovarius sp.]
ALGEAIGGSEAGFIRRMNQMARAMGMTRTTFKNANGLTKAGHLSTARDMTTLGRHLLYDFPQYYNLFSRRSEDAGVRTVNNTNRRFLDSYRGADGIKTGYTSAAGYNLVASAERGRERIIATVFGGRSTASRNAKVAELLDLGFRRAPSSATLRLPPRPPYFGKGGAPAPSTAPPADAPGGSGSSQRPPAGHVVRVVTAVAKSPRPKPRPQQATPAASDALLAAIEDGVEDVVETTTPAPTVPPVTELAETNLAPAPAPAPPVVAAEAAAPAPAPVPAPPPRPQDVTIAATDPSYSPVEELEIVTHVSTSGDGSWGIEVGRFTTRYDAERVLLKIALGDLGTLGNALRKAANRPDGWHATFVGMSEEAADLACRRLEARAQKCRLVGPG